MFIFDFWNTVRNLKYMFKRILFIVIGLVVAAAVVSVIEALSHQIYPLPDGIGYEDIDALKEYIQNDLPVGAMLFVMLAHAVGTFAGSFTATKLSKGKASAGIIVGMVMMIFGLITLFTLPHPLWMSVLDLAVYLPAAYFGVKAAK